MKVADALGRAQKAMTEIEGAARDARWLLASAMGVKRDRLTLMAEDDVPRDALDKFRAMVTKRIARVPVAHLIGEREFYGRTFFASADALDPRPETEIVIRAAMEDPFERVLDLGTGSGVILMTLLAEQPKATGLCTDVSIAALALTEKNARKAGVVKRAQVIRSNWFEAVTGEFDLIVSNPPYIPAAEMASLAPELSYEPEIALTDGADGLSAYRAIFAGAQKHLAPGGRIVVEFGAGQGEHVQSIARAHGWVDTSFRADLDNRDRVLIAKKAEGSRIST
ncbi:MAG: peptide chain release factor N(5)-glutamine methyltransferase [Pseudomonadota bacterium]